MKYMLSKFLVHFGEELTAEASELGVGPGFVPGRRLWNDSMDWGLDIESDVSGKVYTFIYSKKLEHGRGWEYTPYQKGCPIKKVVVFNDWATI